MSLGKRTRWVMRRPIIIPFWEEYWEKLSEKKLIEELKKKEARLDALEEGFKKKDVKEVQQGALGEEMRKEEKVSKEETLDETT